MDDEMDDLVFLINLSVLLSSIEQFSKMTVLSVRKIASLGGYVWFRFGMSSLFLLTLSAAAVWFFRGLVVAVLGSLLGVSLTSSEVLAAALVVNCGFRFMNFGPDCAVFGGISLSSFASAAGYLSVSLVFAMISLLECC